MKKTLCSLPLLALLLVPTPARAGDAASDEAEKKFDQGIKEMDASHFDVACPLLAESYRLEPLAGALFTLAECESKWGKLAASLEHYDQYLEAFQRMGTPQRARQGGRDRIAKTQREALAKDVPELTLTLPASAPTDVTVRLDKAPLALASLGKAQRLDPGDHVVVVQTRDGKERELKLSLGAGDKRSIELKLPEKEPEPIKPVAAPADETTKSSSHLPWTITAASVGVVGVTIGIITGVMAMGDRSTVDQHCRGPTGTECDATGKAAGEDGKTMGIVSTIGFIAGGVGLATAAILFFTEPKKPAAAAVGHVVPNVFVGPQGAWVGAHVTF
jgi:hypothetical protein